MSLMLFHRSQGTANKKKVLNLKFKWNRNLVTHVYFSSVCDLLYLRLRIKYTSYCYQCLYMLSGYRTNYTATETWYLGCKLFSYILSLGKKILLWLGKNDIIWNTYQVFVCSSYPLILSTVHVWLFTICYLKTRNLANVIHGR